MTAPAQASPVAARRRLAAALREARALRRRSLDEAAAALECSTAKISRIENAMVRVSVQDVRELAAYYGHGNVDALLDLARAARGRGWWDRWADMLPDLFTTYLGLEDEACDLWTWEPSVLPGLLQTPAYARAAMEGAGTYEPDVVERGMELRAARQRLLGRDEPPAVWAIVDESALRRPLPDRAAWAGQLRALLDVMEQVTLQVLPLAAGPSVAWTPKFTVLGFADAPRVAYTEMLHDSYLVDGPATVGEYLARFDRLRGLALDGPGTAGLIGGVLREAGG